MLRFSSQRFVRLVFEVDNREAVECAASFRALALRLLQSRLYVSRTHFLFHSLIQVTDGMTKSSKGGKAISVFTKDDSDDPNVRACVSNCHNFTLNFSPSSRALTRFSFQIPRPLPTAEAEVAPVPYVPPIIAPIPLFYIRFSVVNLTRHQLLLPQVPRRLLLCELLRRYAAVQLAGVVRVA
jgi:hypothetical protein